MNIFAMSDIHGNVDAFKRNLDLIDLNNEDNKLILLGDYLSRYNYEDVRVIKMIIDLQNKYKDRVIALMGNHELYLLDDYKYNNLNINDEIIDWINNLPYYYETKDQIYVHAGVDEEVGEYWKVVDNDSYFCNKYPYSIGTFHKDIIAGHISALEIASIENECIENGDIYYDGKSHYYIDGDTEHTNLIPMLMYDCKIKKYQVINKN